MVLVERADPPRPAGAWWAEMAETRSALRMPDVPAIPSWLASDLSSGSSMVESPPERFDEVEVCAGAVLVSVTCKNVLLEGGKVPANSDPVAAVGFPAG